MKIVNGILTQCSLPFEIHLIPKENKTSRSQLELIADSITVHNIGNKSTASQNTIYIDKAYTRYASWHFTIGDGIIYQELPINEVAWHAGDGYKGQGNRTSIAIEVVETKEAEELAIKFIAMLSEYLGITNIVPHKHWSGKYCPRIILPHWKDFIEKIKGESMTKKEIQEALKILGYYNGAIDGSLGAKSKIAIKNFQTDYDLVVDGSAGYNTQKKLKEALESKTSLTVDERLTLIEQKLAEIEKKL